MSSWQLVITTQLEARVSTLHGKETTLRHVIVRSTSVSTIVRKTKETRMDDKGSGCMTKGDKPKETKVDKKWGITEGDKR